MKEIILACLLATSAASAFAEWTKVGESDEINFYIDFSTIRKDGGWRKVWVIHDLKQRYKGGEMSARYRSEYDCKDERTRFVSFSSHSESMAGGETLYSDSSTDPWRAIPPNTTSEKILKIVCAK